MNSQDALLIARRFAELPADRRRLFLEGLRAEGIDFSLLPIPSAAAAKDRAALSYAQRRMWFLWQLEPSGAAYNLPSAVRLRGRLNEAALARAFESLVERHETLRTVFPSDRDAGPRQAPLSQPLRIEQRDLRGSRADERERQVQAEVEQHALAPFDLEQGPLLRIRSLKLADDEHVLLLCLHHIVSDGWSMNVLIDEFARYYRAYDRGLQPDLPALPIQYSDYAVWARRFLEAGESERQLAYWRSALGDVQPVLELPSDRPRPAVPSYRGARHEFSIEPEVARALADLARSQHVTLFTVLLAGFDILLHRYSGQAELRVGVPIANRHREEVEGLIGCLVNTQVLPARLASDMRVDALISQLREVVLAAQAHQDLPFEQLVEALSPERSLSRSPLFSVMYNHQPRVAAVEELRVGEELSLQAIERHARTTQFDLSLDTYEQAAQLRAAFTYATDLFDAASIERLTRHFLRVLAAIAADPTQRIGELPMLSRQDRALQTQQWNQTTAPFPHDRCVHTLIEAQVERTPDALALVFGAERLSYAELNRRANRLAHALIARGVAPETLVGIALPRSVELVVGLLAILKAGAAYVPIDPEYPEARIAYMLEDSGIELLLTDSRLLETLPVLTQVRALCLDAADSYAAQSSNPERRVLPENLAYVIYTSGSTGRPKGAGNRHSALTNRLCWMQRAYGLRADDAVLQKTPFSFDVSVWEFFWPLLTGARLVVAAPGAHREPAQLIETIREQQVTTLHFVPSMLQAFLSDEGVSSCTSLSRILCSGEALSVEAQQQVFARLPQVLLANLYGPTEAAIDVTQWTCVDEGRLTVPIGRPIDNLRVHIVGAELELGPIGFAGELLIGGVGLARGYHARPGLSAERFIPDPFSEDGGRLYRTGDLARYRPDGVVEYAGRIDHQVKIRGFRIELGEIEARLLEQPALREAVVVAQEGPAGKQLVGYVVARDGAADAATLIEQLRSALKLALPDYMLPSQLVVLTQLPLTPNGKLDRNALPKPDASSSQKAYVEPQTQLQKELAEIWARVLKRQRVGLHDNFFELGGDSIVSIQVVSQARQAGIHFTAKDLFQRQTVLELAAVAQVGAEGLAIDQGPVSGELPLSPIQRWFFEQVIPERDHWNQALVLRPTQHLKREPLDAAIRALVEHHDALRLRFAVEADGPKAVHASLADSQKLPLLWAAELADAAELPQLGSEAQRSLNLEQGPLLRAVLVSLADGSQRLVLAIHHLVVDGVSWRVLLADLQTAYRQAESGQALRLPAKTSAYKVWAEKVRDYAQSSALDAELAHYRAALEGATAELPCDRPQGSLQNRYGETVRTQLRAELTHKLLQQAPAAYRTQINDLLLTALARVVAQWTGRGSVLVQLEGHGREDLFADVDLSRTVGWFTTMFPVKLTAAADLGESIKAVKEQLRAVPQKGFGFGLLSAWGTEDVRETLRALPAPKITFNYLGQFDAGFDAASALFTPSGDSAGPEQSAAAPLGNELSLDSQIYAGELQLRWSFSGQRFDTATIERVAAAYTEELERLIAHCCEESARGVTPSDFPLVHVTQAQLDALPLPVKQLEELYPLSPMQKGMLFHTLYDQSSGDYVNQLRVDVVGLDVERFRAAWQAAVSEHDILRTGFLWQGDLAEPVQVVHRLAELPFSLRDGRTHANVAEALELWAEGERQQGFDLARPPLLRLLLVRTADDRHHLIYTSHHILMDGWSNSQLLGKVLSRYAGQAPAASAGRYSDYIAWLARQDSHVSEAFWKRELAALEDPTRLSTAIGGPRSHALGHGKHVESLSARDTRRLTEFARQHKLTVNTLVQAAWLLLLHRYTGQAAVVVGMTVAGRPPELTGIEQQLGLFINTLPLLAAPHPEQRAGDWLRELQAQNVRLREQEHTPLNEIQRWAGHGGEALFDTLLVFGNYPVSEALENHRAGELRFEGIANREQTNYPLTVGVSSGETLTLQYDYMRASFSAEQIARLAQHWRNLLAALIAQPAQRLGELSLLDEAERQTQLVEWNHPELGYALDSYVHQRVEAQAARRPAAPALLLGDAQLSYRELNEKANRLAHRLIELGVGPEVRVAVATERSLETIVGFLATLKSGGAYVPLDPEYPAERLRYMLEDSGVALVLTQSFLQPKLPIAQGLPVLCLDREDSYGARTDNPALRLHPEQLAYVIYTSGSTGKPKGVSVAHGPLSMHIEALADCYETAETDSELQFMSFAFDGAHEHWLKALTRGARMVLRGAELWTPEEMYAAMHRYGTTVTVLPPVYLLQLAQYAEQRGDPPAMRIYCFGGDAVPDASFELAKRALRPEHIINGYGPTETVVTPLLWKAGREQSCDAAYAPIGRRVGDRVAYVLDGSLQLVPIGLSGELYLGGYGVARGYHDNPALTALRFVPDPFSETGGRLYRSGDLTRARPDGVVDYVGRVDYQVKVRGFRIELGEIEARLQERAEVREAVVVAHDGPVGKQLVGYVVPTDPDADSTALSERLRSELKALLPDYMVPAHLLVLTQLPLTPNGKLDRKALPKPSAGGSQRQYVEPRTAVEKQIASIWADVLQLERVGLRDNFFELGGDSIISIQVVSRARQLGIRFTPKDLFQQQTVQALAAVAKLGGAGLIIDQGPVQGSVPLLPIQEWFFAQDIPERQHWNQSVVLRPTQPLAAEYLEAALQALVAHHDALRLRFQASEGGWAASHGSLEQARSHSLLWAAELHDASELEGIGARAQRSLDLEQGPLVRAVLARVADGSQRLLLAIHHLVVDGVSWRVLLEDLQTAYRQLASGQALQLPPKTTAFKRWAEKLRGYAESPALQSELEFWQAQLEDGARPLPCDHPNGGLQNRCARTVYTQLDEALTHRLVHEAPAAYRTQINELLLTALARVVARWTQERSAFFQLEGHGREALFDDVDLSRSVGWFTSMFPVKLTPAEGLADSIKAVKEQLRALPDKGIGFGILSVFGDAATKRALQERPGPKITFNYLGQFDSSFGATDALFAPSREFPGPEQSPDAPLGNELSLNGQIFGGELRLGWTFSAERYEDASIQQLAVAYRQELEALIAHCCDAAHGGVTPSDFPLVKVTQAQLDALPLAAQQIEDLYPLSPMQQGLLFHTLLEPRSGIYYMQDRYAIRSELDVSKFAAAWAAVIRRHDALRVSFSLGQDGQMLQIVQRDWAPQLIFDDFCDRPWEEHEADVLALLAADRERGFDLLVAPPIQLRLIRRAQSQYWFVFAYHHILIDAWCRSIVYQDFFTLYQGGSVPSAGRYRDFIAWLQTQGESAAIEAWRGELQDFEQITPLPFDRPVQRTKGMSAVADRIIELEPAQGRALYELAQRHQLTVNTFAQAAWALVLYRYSGLRDVLFGVTVAGRPTSRPDMQQTVGLFINSIPLRLRVPPQGSGISVKQWLQDILAHNFALREHEHLSLVQIQGCSSIEKGLPLFDSLFVYESAPMNSGVFENAQQIRAKIAQERTHTNYPITVVIYPGDALGLHLSYDRRFFDEQTIDQLLADFKRSLLALYAGFHGEVSSLQLAAAEEVLALQAAREETRRDYPLNAGYAALFERQVDAGPERVAAARLDESWTYRGLDERANRVAHALVAAARVADEPVALLAERGLPLLGMMIGCFKAGAGYLGLDPQLPDGRLQEVLASARPRVLLTVRAQAARAQALLASLPELRRPPLVCWEDLQTERFASARLGVHTTGQNLAYVIYTSGSTGKPKGVLVEQAGMLNNQLSKIPYLGLTERDVIAQTASQSFDISVWQFLTAPLCGARVEIVPNEIAHDPQALLEHVRQRRVTVLESVPSLIQSLLDEPDAALPQLRWLLPTGEAMPLPLAQRWLARYPGIGLVNAYGPAECSDDVSLYHVERVSDDSVWLPIGTPTDNNQLYILSDDLQPMPRGAVGELYAAGVGVGRGYLNDRGRTSEAFLPNPFGAEGSRLYRTGDLARRRADGVLEYVGRIDQQVKIRGFRIELGEIEARLQDREEVRDAVVVAHEGPTGKQLVGYVVARQAGADASALCEQLRATLKSALPDYMVPAYLVLLERLPLTANGKLDRKALPAPDASALQRAYLAPQTALEQQIAAIWSDVLKLPRVGLSDNFFELGGHSLLATQVVSRVKHQVGLDVGLRSFFEAEHLAGFVAAVQRSRKTSEPPLVAAKRTEPVALSYAQQRLWFLWQLEPESTAYHLPVALHLEGRLDGAALRRAFEALVARHESLRTRFVQAGDRPLQVIEAAMAVPVEHVELNLVALDEATRAARRRAWVEEQISQPFDLERGPLLRVKLLREAADEHVLLLVMHHIVSDGWSMQRMVEELVALYRGYSRGEPVELAPLGIQYADYALWQRSWMEAGERERQLAYWTERLGGEQPLLELPADRARPPEQSYRGAQIEVPLSETHRLGLSQLAQREGTTLFTLLLASFQALLHRYTGQNDIRVGVPIANRNRVETERLIGFFVNTQVLRAHVDGQLRFAELLQQVKNAALDAQVYQDLPFEHLVEALQPERSLSHSPLFQVMVSHMIEESGQGELALPELHIEHLTWATQAAQFDLTLDIHESPAGIYTAFTYATDLFDAPTIERLIRHWHNLLTGILAEPSQRVSELPLLTEAELSRQLGADSAREYPLDAGYAALFEQQVERTPQRVAATCLDEAWTYRALDERANRVGHALLEAACAPDQPVVLLAERGLPLLAMLIGSFKAGAGYLALDPQLPDARLLELLTSVGARVLLTDRAHVAKASQLSALLPERERPRLLAWEDLQSARYPAQRPGIYTGARHLAYVIYTSGSTGKPKGVLVEQGGMLNNQLSKIPYLALGERDVIAQTASASFDISVWQFLTAPLCGARVDIVPNAIAHDPAALLRHVSERQITVLESVPALIQAMLDQPAVSLPSLRWLLPTGEAMPIETARHWRQRYPEVGLVNAYGPAECSDDVALYRVEREPSGSAWLAIGSATDNHQLYVLGDDLQPLPAGAVGELYVSGVGVGRGYLNDRERTAQVFLPNPFGEAGTRLYRTGDRARYRADGTLEYAGRTDHQVKIRGFRIELGEIEARLSERDEVRDAVVVAQDSPFGKQLVGYIVPRDAAADNAVLREQLRAALKAALPDYMVPAQLLLLERLPLTANGKLDRDALPKPDASDLQKAYVEPRTQLEQLLAAIWAEVLKLPRVGLSDNFFELGGHSLLATQVVSRMKERGLSDIPIRLLFAAEDLAEFAAAVQAASSKQRSVQSEVERALEELEQLSVDELEKLIA